MTSTVLIVDDDGDLRTLAMHTLTLIGHEARQASDGSTALALLAEAPLPDLVLLDVQMPGLDGWGTLEAIRSDARTHDLRVVFATVMSHPRDQLRGWVAGCDGYITKPYDIHELDRTLKDVLVRDDAERLQVREQHIAVLTRDDVQA